MVQFYSNKIKKQSNTQLDGPVEITDLDAFGQGVVHYQGKTLFITDALPGEIVQVKLTENKRNYAKGIVTKRLKESSQRVLAQCPHYDQCGGCQQQHIATPLQRESKRQALWQLLKEQTSLTTPAEIALIAAEPYHYRRRVRFSLRYEIKQKRLVLGFRQKASHQITPISTCSVLEPKLADLIAPLSTCLNELAGAAQLGHVELVAADNSIIMVLRHLKPLSISDRNRLEHFTAQHKIICYLADGQQLHPLSVAGTPFYCLDHLRLNFNPQGFIQVNRTINQAMVAQAKTWLDLHEDDIILDLFCGVGNFSLPFAEKVKQVIAVEGVAALATLTSENAKANGLHNVLSYHENLDVEIEQQAWTKAPFNKVLLDPARQGAYAAAQFLAKRAPERIVYVSCNPATLVRDCHVLTRYYSLDKVSMLDMFPQTNHLEAMILLRRK